MVEDENVLSEEPRDTQSDGRGLQEIVACSELLDDAGRYLHGYLDPHPEHRYRLESALPEINAETLHSLGIPELPCHVDEEATANFRKEDEMEVSRDQFRVVQDQDGKRWLLKSASDRNKGTDIPKIFELQSIRFRQEEVFSFRLAEKIGYPVVETRLVEHEGKPWVAYEFRSKAQDWFALDHDWQAPDFVRNRQEVEMLPLFNAVSGSSGDPAMQGIIDRETDTFFASDNTVDIAQGMRGERSDPYDLQQNFNETGYGPKPPSEATAAFLVRLDGLTDEACLEIFQDRIGSRREIEDTIRWLQHRVVSLKYLHEAGFFSGEREFPEPDWQGMMQALIEEDPGVRLEQDPSPHVDELIFDTADSLPDGRHRRIRIDAHHLISKINTFDQLLTVLHLTDRIGKQGTRKEFYTGEQLFQQAIEAWKHHDPQLLPEAGGIRAALERVMVE